MLTADGLDGTRRGMKPPLRVSHAVCCRPLARDMHCRFITWLCEAKVERLRGIAVDWRNIYLRTTHLLHILDSSKRETHHISREVALA